MFDQNPRSHLNTHWLHACIHSLSLLHASFVGGSTAYYLKQSAANCTTQLLKGNATVI